MHALQAALLRLTDIQRDQVQLAAARAQRQKDLDAARAAAASSSSSSKRRSASASGSGSSSDKGKSRAAREGSPTHSGDSGSGSSASSPNGKKSRRRAADAAASSSSSPGAAGAAGGEAQGFAGLRDSLSSYLAPRSSADGAASQRSPPPASSVVKRGPLRALGRYLAEHYAADPVRLLSAVLFAFAFATWARRRVVHRRARGESGLGVGDVLRLMGARVGDTFGMMTRITAM